MYVKGLNLPAPLDTRILEVEVDRISNSGTPIAYPTDPEYERAFTGRDGIHLSEGEPGDVFMVELMKISGESAEARLTFEERADADYAESSDEFTAEEIREREQKIAKKSKANEQKNQEAMNELAEGMGTMTEEKQERADDDDADGDEEPFSEGIRGSKNSLL